MTDNPTLISIRQRRSVRNFTPEPVSDEQLEAILEAGRWAPSARNSQPWEFVVIRDPQIRTSVGDILRRTTFAWKGFANAPVIVVVAVDPSRDPEHFVEDGAVAAHNLCLAAQSLGLASCWAGIHSGRGEKGSAESALKTLLSVPRALRIIAVVPIGTARHGAETSRRPLADIVHHDRFRSAPDPASRETRSEEAAQPEDGSRQLAPRRRRRRSSTESGRFL